MLPVQVERQQPGGPFGAGGEGLAQGVDLFAMQRIEVMGHGATQDRAGRRANLRRLAVLCNEKGKLADRWVIYLEAKTRKPAGRASWEGQ
ncbi:hypothetical protein EY04_23270 [Pseudomonas chlororaphis]|nr:hypothetical protein EY04_23270 [Pseudomonas chlororaphis]